MVIFDLQVLVQGKYQLQVLFHSFSNHDGKCADDSCFRDIFCCELSVCPNTCHYYFSLCQRPAGSQVSYVRGQDHRNCLAPIITSMTSDEERNMFEFADMLFGINNPILFCGDEWVKLDSSSNIFVLVSLLQLFVCECTN